MYSALPGVISAKAVSSSPGMWLATSSRDMRRSASPWTKMYPPRASSRSALTSKPTAASSRAFSRSSPAACTTAVPVEKVAVEPAVMGATGVREVSAETTRTSSYLGAQGFGGQLGQNCVSPLPHIHGAHQEADLPIPGEPDLCRRDVPWSAPVDEHSHAPPDLAGRRRVGPALGYHISKADAPSRRHCSSPLLEKGMPPSTGWVSTMASAGVVRMPGWPSGRTRFFRRNSSGSMPRVFSHLVHDALEGKVALGRSQGAVRASNGAVGVHQVAVIAGVGAPVQVQACPGPGDG